MVDMRYDDLLHTYRRTINLEIASAIAELLDTKAVIFCAISKFDPTRRSSAFNHDFYKKICAKKISQSKTGII